LSEKTPLVGGFNLTLPDILGFLGVVLKQDFSRGFGRKINADFKSAKSHGTSNQMRLECRAKVALRTPELRPRFLAGKCSSEGVKSQPRVRYL
jgi:hypothetical protein